MLLLAVRIAVGVVLLTRGGSSRKTRLAATILLPGPMRAAMAPVLLAADAVNRAFRDPPKRAETSNTPAVPPPPPQRPGHPQP